MEEPYCAQCIHYVPHYIKFGENLFDLIRCGHCTYPRKKHRDAYAKPSLFSSPSRWKTHRNNPRTPSNISACIFHRAML